MRFIAFIRNGKREIGLVEGGQVLPLEALTGSPCRDLAAVIEGGSVLLARLRAQAAAAPKSQSLAAEGLALALPLEAPGKIVCLGLNYADHAKEGGYAVPEYPAFFLRTRTSMVAAGAPLVKPRVSDMFDYEAELMVVIGAKGRHVSEADALDHVFGYCCFNDASVRDYQRKTTQWTAGKNFDGTGAIGPAVVTAHELPPGAAGLAICCRLNGKIMQQANTSQMMVSVAKAIALLSEFMTLEPGDLIAMGTPQGVGHARKPPVWMRPGDTVEVEIEGIGVLTNPVVVEAAG